MAKWVFFFDDCDDGTIPPSGYIEASTARDALRLLGNHPEANVIPTWDDVELGDDDGPVWCSS